MAKRIQWTYEKLLAHSLRECSTNCLIWQRAKVSGGYAQLKYEQKNVAVHRFVWQLFNGPIPETLVVRHSCHIRACINIEHLSIGTSADNNHDTVQAGRQAKGSKNGKTKLSEEAIIDIRQRLNAGNTLANIGALYGVTSVTIYKIKSGRTWRHVS
jgi:hypothetical protein